MNRNTNSLYYGRVFVSNAEVGLNPAFDPGDRLGLLKLNADGSRRKVASAMAVGFWMATIRYRRKSRFRKTILFMSMTVRADWCCDLIKPFPPLPGAFPPAPTTGRTAPPRISAVRSSPALAPIRRYGWPTPIIRAAWVFAAGRLAAPAHLAANDLGITIVPAATNLDLNLAPIDVAVDRSNRVYTIQSRDTSGDPARRVMRFPAYDGSAEAPTNSDWSIGSGDDNMRGALGIAVDPTATYVAVAFSGFRRGPRANGWRCEDF